MVYAVTRAFDFVLARARGKTRALAGLGALLLAASGCGHSSKSKPAQSTAPTSTQSSTVAPPPQALRPGVVTGSSGGVTATLYAGTHHPRAGQPWPFAFGVRSRGRPARASVGYEYLFAGQVVAHRSHYTFIGHFSDVSVWPSSAVGYPLTFRAVVVSAGVTIDLDYPVQVTR